MFSCTPAHVRFRADDRRKGINGDRSLTVQPEIYTSIRHSNEVAAYRHVGCFGRGHYGAALVPSGTVKTTRSSTQDWV
jgi:hypothetical protein